MPACTYGVYTLENHSTPITCTRALDSKISMGHRTGTSYCNFIIIYDDIVLFHFAAVSVVGFVVGLTVGILGLVFGILCVVFCTIGWCIYCARKRAPKGSSVNVRWTPKTKTVEANPDPPPYPRT